MEEKTEMLENLELEDTRQGKYMTFCIGSDVFGIELKYVNEIIQMPIIPVIDVADRFGKELFEYNDRTCIIVVDVQGVTVGLIVETISEVVSIEEEDILPPPSVSKTNAQAKFIRGIGKLGDSVKLLLDPVKLLSDESLDFTEKQEEEEEE